jgi:hypothetical protein
MGQDLERRTSGTPSRRPEPSWSTVAGTTLRLWLERHHLVSPRPGGRRKRLVLVLSALVAMAFGAGITLAFTGANQQASPGGRVGAGTPGVTPPQQAIMANRLDAAKWITSEVSAGVDVSCDSIMCREAQQKGYPAGQLMVLSSTAPDPLGAELIIATPAIRNQFGTRLASVYAPQLIARFGSGPEEVDVRYVVPGGAAAFNAQLATDLKDRVAAGEQLLSNSHILTGPTARSELRAGQVDPRLLITLAALAGKIAIQLVAFDDSSPGEGFAVPLRGAEIATSAPGGLSAILAILRQQISSFAPTHKGEIKLASGQSVVTVRYGAPGPMDVGGS